MMTADQFRGLIRDELPLIDELDIRIVSMADGRAVIRLPYQPRFLRPGGVVSGPPMMLLADVAMYAAVMSLETDGKRAVTTNLNTTFLRKAKPADLVAKAEMINTEGAMMMGEVSILSDGESEPVAHVTATYWLPGE